jgi:RHS repeat-associated protein
LAHAGGNRPWPVRRSAFAAFALLTLTLVDPGPARAMNTACQVSGGDAQCQSPLDEEFACKAGIPPLVGSHPYCGPDSVGCPDPQTAILSMDNPEHPACPIGAGPVSISNETFKFGKLATYLFSFTADVALEPNCGQLTTYDGSGGCGRKVVCVGAVLTDILNNQCKSQKSEACPAGNPINCGDGNKIQTEADYAGGSGSPLRFVRFYSSSGFYTPPLAERSRAVLGAKWRHSYQRQVIVQGADAAGHAVLAMVVQPDGDYRHFRWQGGSWVGRSDKSERLLETRVGGTLTGWQYTSAADSIERFDAQGRLLRVEESDGRFVELEYSNGTVDPSIAPGAGYLVVARDHQGRALALRYDERGRLAGMTDPSGASYTYAYSIGGILERVQYPDARSRRYFYDEAANLVTPMGRFELLTGIEDESGVRYADFRYNEYGQGIESRHAGGADRTQIRHPWSVLVDSSYGCVTDALGNRRTRYFVNAKGVLKDAGTSVPYTPANPNSQCLTGHARTTITYDANGNKDRYTDYRGIITDYDFNTMGQETRRSEVANTTCPSALPNCQLSRRTTETVWHASFRVPTERRVKNSGGVVESITRFAYNSRGQLSAECKVDPQIPAAVAYACGSLVDAPFGVRQTRNDYCEAADVAISGSGCPRVGLLKQVDGPRTDAIDRSTYMYFDADHPDCATAPQSCAYRRGDLRVLRNALGHETEFLAYDGAGRVLRTRDANGVLSDMSYSPRGWLLTRTQRERADGVPSAGDATTRLEYEPYGEIKRVVQADGSAIDYTRDAAHRLVAIVDNDGNRITYTLDAAGNRLKEEARDAGGALKRALARQVDAFARIRAEINMPHALQPNLDDPSVKKWAYAFDANGNPDTTTDPLNRVVDNDYDPLNRMIRSVQDKAVGGINASTQFVYDARDNLRTVIDPKGLGTHYSYDGLNDLYQLQSPDTGLTRYVYDSGGNRVAQIDARGTTTVLVYDALNRVRSISYLDSSLDISFEYDQVASACRADAQYALGRLSRFSDESGGTEFCYDQRGNLLQKIQTAGEVVLSTSYGYTLADRLDHITYPSGRRVRFGRDATGRIDAVFLQESESAPEVAVITGVGYLPFGPVDRIEWAGGVVQDRGYDQNYGIDQIQSSAGDGLAADFGLDEVGNITTISSAAGQNSFGYDALYRLNSETAGSLPARLYSYDATGNRLSASTSEQGSTQAYVYAADSHRLLAVGAAERVLDENGNLLNPDRFNRGGLTFDYNDRNRLSQVNQNGQPQQRYHHNARGERVQKEVVGSRKLSTWFAYDEAGHLLGEYDQDGGALREYVWLDDLPVALLQDATWFAIEPDHLGSPRSVIDVERQVAVWRWDLHGSAFGGDAPDEDPDGDRNTQTLNLRFPGQYYDAETNYHYNYFRDYDPATGRYIESDPIGLDAGLSTYAYVASAPLDQWDPDGLRSRCRPGAVHAIPGNASSNCVPKPPTPPKPDCPPPGCSRSNCIMKCMTTWSPGPIVAAGGPLFAARRGWTGGTGIGCLAACNGDFDLVTLAKYKAIDIPYPYGPCSYQ